MAIHTNDVMLLPTSSFQVKFCENFTNEDISITPFNIYVCSKDYYPMNSANLIKTFNSIATFIDFFDIVAISLFVEIFPSPYKKIAAANRRGDAYCFFKDKS